MNKNYRGPAESKELSEDGPAIDQADKGSAKNKKGSADYDVKKGSHGHPHGGAAQELTSYQKILQYGKDVAKEKKDDLKQKQEDFRNASMLDSINLEASGQSKKRKRCMVNTMSNLVAKKINI
jgi:hypothetical protein